MIGSRFTFGTAAGLEDAAQDFAIALPEFGEPPPPRLIRRDRFFFIQVRAGKLIGVSHGSTAGPAVHVGPAAGSLHRRNRARFQLHGLRRGTAFLSTVGFGPGWGVQPVFAAVTKTAETKSATANVEIVRGSSSSFHCNAGPSPVVEQSSRGTRAGCYTSRRLPLKMASILIRKPLDMILDEAGQEGENSLKRALGATNLIALGIGAIIGTGIFVLTGSVAAQNSGPAIVLSFHFCRNRVYLRRAMLRRIRLFDPDRRICVHLRLRHARRTFRLDHRLGLDPRICLRGRDRGLWMVGQRGAIAARLGLDLPPQWIATPGTSSPYNGKCGNPWRRCRRAWTLPHSRMRRQFSMWSLFSRSPS